MNFSCIFYIIDFRHFTCVLLCLIQSRIHFNTEIYLVLIQAGDDFTFHLLPKPKPFDYSLNIFLPSVTSILPIHFFLNICDDFFNCCLVNWNKRILIRVVTVSMGSLSYPLILNVFIYNKGCSIHTNMAVKYCYKI